MLQMIVLIFALSLHGCAFQRYVDPKGRDCKNNAIPFFTWQTCQEKQEPLATTKQEIKVDADIRQNTIEVK